MRSIFLLSPANTAGKRAAILMNPQAEFELARRLRDDELTIGELSLLERSSSTSP